MLSTVPSLLIYNINKPSKTKILLNSFVNFMGNFLMKKMSKMLHLFPVPLQTIVSRGRRLLRPSRHLLLVTILECHYGVWEIHSVSRDTNFRGKQHSAEDNTEWSGHKWYQWLNQTPSTMAPIHWPRDTRWSNLSILTLTMITIKAPIIINIPSTLTPRISKKKGWMEQQITGNCKKKKKIIFNVCLSWSKVSFFYYFQMCCASRHNM